MAKPLPVIRFVLPLQEADAEERLKHIVYPGIFLPGRRWANSPGKFIFEGHVGDGRFSIRRITGYKWLFPMMLGSWEILDGSLSVTIKIDEQHLVQVTMLAYTIAGSGALSIGLGLVFGRFHGAGMLSSYFVPVAILAAAVLFVMGIKGISRMKFQTDTRYLKTLLAGRHPSVQPSSASRS